MLNWLGRLAYTLRLRRLERTSTEAAETLRRESVKQRRQALEIRKLRLDAEASFLQDEDESAT